VYFSGGGGYNTFLNRYLLLLLLGYERDVSHTKDDRVTCRSNVVYVESLLVMLKETTQRVMYFTIPPIFYTTYCEEIMIFGTNSTGNAERACAVDLQ
jgi:hypothetical protein